MKQVPHGPGGLGTLCPGGRSRVATDKAKSLGGKVMKDITEVRIWAGSASFQDPAGSILGLWKTNRETMQADHGAKREGCPKARRRNPRALTAMKVE